MRVLESSPVVKGVYTVSAEDCVESLPIERHSPRIATLRDALALCIRWYVHLFPGHVLHESS